MMSPNEIFEQAASLPYKEREKLLKKLEGTLKKDAFANGTDSSDQARKQLIAERKRSVDYLRGIAAVPGKKPPTDEEWREERTNYLLEKYK